MTFFLDFGLIASAWAASTWALSPFGSVPELVRDRNPWHGFDADGPVLTVVRIQEFQTDSCESWIRALLSDLPGAEGSLKPGSFSDWTPWSAQDLDSVVSCKKFPCEVKLNSAETSQLAKKSDKDRLKEFQSLILTRISHYMKTEERKSSEFPGDPIHPWKHFEKLGFASSQKRPKAPVLYLRKLDFAPRKTRVLRQILDRRSASSGKLPSEREATVWLRDVYTDHYFDSWGEWTHLKCKGASGKEVLLVQSLVVELDLLKKTDLYSRMMRGKMRSVIRENGSHYLNSAYERLLFNSKLKKNQ